MPTFLRLAAAAAFVAVLGAGVIMFGNGGDTGGPSTPPPTPSAQPTLVPTASPAGSPAASPAAAGPFTSPLFGYTVTRPAGWTVIATTLPWTAGGDPRFDVFAAPVSQSPDFDDVSVSAQPVPGGVTTAAWLLAYAERVAASPRDCKGPVEAWTDEDVGSLAIRRLDLECQGAPGQTLNLVDVAFVVDGTGYVMSGNPTVIAQFLDEFEPGT
jgi:hypothetical protein